MTVTELQVATDGVLEFAGVAVSAAPKLFFGQRREPALDQVEPGSAGRREVQVEAWMTQQPALDRRSLVGGELSMIRCSWSGAGTAWSMVSRNLRNSIARCR
jgi:hypothetical protein